MKMVALSHDIASVSLGQGRDITIFSLSETELD